MAQPKKINTGEDGTGRFKGISKKLTDEQRAINDEIDLGPHLIQLYWNEPFFSTFYRAMNRHKTREIGTAGVGIQATRPALFWNPDFIASLSHKKVMGLLKHEVYHLNYDHVTFRALEPHMIWNWAADLSINCSIPRDELPDGGFIPGEKLKVPEPEDWAEMSDEEKARFTKISTLVESFDPFLTAEEYFFAFMENDEVKDMIKEAEERQQKLEEMLGEALQRALSGGDDHGNWGQDCDENGNSKGEISDGVRQMLEGELSNILRDAVNKADGSNAWGSVPQHMRSQLRSMVSTEVDWRVILRQFFGRSRRSSGKSTRKRVNRKLPHVFPGRTRNYTANIAIYVDQSGSVSNEALALFYAELRNFGKKTTFHFFPFDTEVDVENGFVWKKGQTMPNLERFRAGGTDFQACVNHAHDNKGLFDGYLILSDGECSKPTPSRIRRGYIIAPGRKLYFTPDPSDIVIQMKGE